MSEINFLSLKQILPFIRKKDVKSKSQTDIKIGEISGDKYDEAASKLGQSLRSTIETHHPKSGATSLYDSVSNFYPKIQIYNPTPTGEHIITPYDDINFVYSPPKNGESIPDINASMFQPPKTNDI